MCECEIRSYDHIENTDTTTYTYYLYSDITKKAANDFCHSHNSAGELGFHSYDKKCGIY